MSGAKGRSGGSVKGSRPNNGGGRTNSGPMLRNLRLSKSAAREVRILLRHRQSLGSDIDEVALVEQFIHEKWIEYDSHINSIVSKLSEYE